MGHFNGKKTKIQNWVDFRLHLKRYIPKTLRRPYILKSFLYNKATLSFRGNIPNDS